MVAAAGCLAWHAATLTAAPGYTDAAEVLLAWCRRVLPRDGWFYPLPSGRTAHGSTDFAVWGFPERADAEAFAQVVLRDLGEAAGVRVLDARTTKAPPWVG